LAEIDNFWMTQKMLDYRPQSVILLHCFSGTCTFREKRPTTMLIELGLKPKQLSLDEFWQQPMLVKLAKLTSGNSSL
jgi:hypothetical protein